MKTKITCFLILALIPFINIAQEVIRVDHCATAATINSEITEIDDPQLNDNPNLVVVVQKVRVDDNGTTINNPHYVGVRYNSVAGRWYIHNENPGYEMVENSCYKLLALDENDPRATKKHFLLGDIISGSLHIAPIDDPEINDDPSVRCLFSRLQDSNEIQNNNPCEMYYNWETPGNWYIATIPGQEMPIDCAFNIISNPPGFEIYEHESTAGNIDSDVIAIDDYAYWTILDHVLLNNDPNALLFITHRREPTTSFIYRGFSIFYNSVTGKWQLHIELESYISGFSFPIGHLFDIFIWDGTLDNSEFNITDNLKVYPNPSNSTFTVEAKQNISEVSVFNIIGQELMVFSGKEKNKLQIDLSTYESGHYFVKIKAGKVIDTVRLLKN